MTGRRGIASLPPSRTPLPPAAGSRRSLAESPEEIAIPRAGMPSRYPRRDFSRASSDIRARCGRFPRAIARKGSRAVRLRGPTVFPSAVLYLYRRRTACTSVVNAPIWKSETNARPKIERRWSDVSPPPWNSLRSPPIYDDPRAPRLGSRPESGDL